MAAFDVKAHVTREKSKFFLRFFTILEFQRNQNKSMDNKTFKGLFLMENSKDNWIISNIHSFNECEISN